MGHSSAPPHPLHRFLHCLGPRRCLDCRPTRLSVGPRGFRCRLRLSDSRRARLSPFVHPMWHPPVRSTLPLPPRGGRWQDARCRSSYRSPQPTWPREAAPARHGDLSTSSRKSSYPATFTKGYTKLNETPPHRRSAVQPPLARLLLVLLVLAAQAGRRRPERDRAYQTNGLDGGLTPLGNWHRNCF